MLDTNRIDLYLTSPATNTTRHYEFADALCQDAVDARVWSGLHFRTADVVALAAGRQVADWVLDHYLQPLRTYPPPRTPPPAARPAAPSRRGRPETAGAVPAGAVPGGGGGPPVGAP